MIRRILYLAVIALLLAIMSGRWTTHAAMPAASDASAAEIKIDNFAFAPPTLKVPVGTQVTWINRDDAPHTVVSQDGHIKSKALDTGEKFTFTFDKPGSYGYVCSLHPQMKGTIVVQ
jgi:plastocyanin